MRNRVNYVVLAALVSVAGLVWMVAKTQRAAVNSASAPVASVPVPESSAPAAPQPVPVRIEIVEVPAAAPTPTPLPAAQPAVMSPLPVTAAPVVTQADGSLRHIVQPGETVNSLAGDLLGKDSKTNRDAIINANASLKADPDKLVAGKAYRIPSATEAATEAASADTVSATPATAVVKAEPVIQPEPIVKAAPAKSAGVKVLKYTAAPGDTLSKMAAAFLGGDSQANENAIIAANPSLQADPDHVEVGRAYRIPAPDGLSASSDATATAPRPTSQPDADQVIVAGSPRALRYTAVAGDTVSKMAIQLLGTDTQETRDLIIANNPSLKKDPDRVIAGQTYWIPAPSASADTR